MEQTWRDALDEWRNPAMRDVFCGLINTHMDWCGCWSPEEVDHLALKALRWAELRFSDTGHAWPAAEFRHRYDAHRKDMGGESAWMLMAYLLDGIDATEHGGSISGAWLTDEGRELLAALEEIYGDAA